MFPSTTLSCWNGSVLGSRLREEHDPQLVLPLDSLFVFFRSLGVCAGVLVSAYKVIVHLIRLSWFASLPYVPERRGQIEGHDNLLGDVSGDVPGFLADLYDAFDLLSVGFGSAIEVSVLNIFEQLVLCLA